jgi:phosphate-selective porin OprO and OprP
MFKGKQFFLIFFIYLNFSVFGQVNDNKENKDNDIKLSASPYYSYGKGIGITSPDSLFQFNIRFRMQNRITYLDNEHENPAYDGQIRRLRLRFDGFIGSPKILYILQLSFAPGDVGEIKDGENLNIIRDAVVFYRPNKNWNFSFGQTKLPGNRQRVNSSGGIQLSDRSINNARFNIDRDFGLQAFYLNEDRNKFSYSLKTAVSTGEGRNFTDKPDDGVAITGKLELLPFGTFAKDGTNFEGDLVREPKPKLMFSGALSQNNNAKRTQGQLGPDLFESKTMRSVLLDGMFKYKGWAAMMSYMSRTTPDNPIAINPLDPTESNYVFVGNGFDYQLSYLTKSNYEFIGRYSTQKVGTDIQKLSPNLNQMSIGITKYFWEHTFKLQSELTFDELNFYNGEQKNNWYLRFQVEIGI